MKSVEPMDSVPEPDGEFEQRIWERIQPQVHQVIRRRKRMRLTAFAMAGAAIGSLLVVVALQRPGATVHKPAENGSEQILQSALSNHLDRSQILLTELAHQGPEEAGTDDENDRAKALLNDNRRLREASFKHGDYGHLAVLDALEPTLLTVANAGPTMEKTEAQGLQEQLKQSSLLFKVRVARSQLVSGKPAVERPL